MGCNTTKEAVQPVEDSNTAATKEQNEVRKDQVVNNAANIVPDIGEYSYVK
jgi:hypothetical protein